MVLGDMFLREYRPPCGRSWTACRTASVVSGALYSVENNGISATAILDNLYRKCYNKCNDDNKKAICHQTVKNAPTKRFCPLPL